MDVLAGQVREAEAQRAAAEEAFERTPGWRFRRRTQLGRRLERRREKEREALALVEIVARKLKAPGSR